jgi:GMP synthase-like glutamine amidotransferase
MRYLRAFLAVVLFYTSVAVPLAEANFWSDRRKFARLPSAVPVLPASVVRMTAPAVPAPAVRDLPALAGLPAAAADVEHVHRAGRGPWVVLLQDAHDVAEAQKNISAVLSHLQQAAGGSLRVGLEGAAGGFDVARFRALSNREENEWTAGYLLDAGHITGAEHFGLTALRAPALFGAEDADLYRANVRAYRAALAARPAAEAALEEARRRAEARAAETFDERLLVYQDAADRHHRGDADLSALLSTLNGLTPGLAGGQVKLFLAALDLEKSLDFAKVEAERRGLIESLAERLDQAALAALLDKSLAFRLGRLDAAAYYAALRETAGAEMARFPEFETYVRYAVTAAKLDGALYEEVESFRRAAGGALARTPEQRRLLDVFEDVRLAEKLLRHELGDREWAAHRARRADMSALLPRETLAPFEKFYEIAEARNEKLVDNLLKHSALSTQSVNDSSLITHDSSLAVLISGGFHTPGLREALAARGVNHVVLRPRIGRVTGRGSEYLSVYAKEPAPLDRLLLGEKVFLAPTGALAFRDLAGLRHGERVRTLHSLLYGLLSALRGKHFRAELQSRLGSDLDVEPRGGGWSLLLRRRGRVAAFRAELGKAAEGETAVAGQAGPYRFNLTREDLPWQSAFARLVLRAAGHVQRAVAAVLFPFRGHALRVALLHNYPISVTGRMVLNHLRSRGVQVDTYEAWAGNLPNWKHYDAIVGSGSAYNPREHRGEAWMEREMNLLRQASIPVLGICFTHQLIAEAFGGVTRKAYGYDIYVGPNEVDVDTADPLFAGLPGTITVAEGHGDEVSELGEELVVTAGSEMARVEALRHRTRPIYGVQFHPEHSSMLEQHGVPKEHGAKVLDNFLDIARRHRDARETAANALKRSRWPALLAALLLGGAALPAAADPWIVQDEKGRPRLNVPALVTRNDDGTETRYGVRSRDRSVELYSTRPLNNFLEWSVYAGGHREERRQTFVRDDRTRYGWHVGIGIRLIPQRPSPPPVRMDRVERERRLDIADVLREMNVPGARAGIVRADGRTAYWVQRADEIAIVTARETHVFPGNNVHEAATYFFGSFRVEVFDAAGRPLPWGQSVIEDPAGTPAEPQAPPETGTKTPGAGAALWGVPLAALAVLGTPSPAAAADFGVQAAAADPTGLVLLLAAVAAAALALRALLKTTLWTRAALAAFFAALTFGFAGPASAQLIVTDADGRVRLNLPPLGRIEHPDGSATVVELQSEDDALNLTATKPLPNGWEGSIYAGAHETERPDRNLVPGDESRDIGWHAGITFRWTQRPPPAPPRTPRAEPEEDGIDISDVLRELQAPGSTAGVVRAGRRTAVWVSRPDGNVVFITGEGTYVSGERDVRAAATYFFGDMRVEVFDSEGNLLPRNRILPPDTETGSQTQGASETGAAGGPSAALWGVPLAVLALVAAPSPASAAGLAAKAAAVDPSGIILLGLVAAAVVLGVFLRRRKAEPARAEASVVPPLIPEADQALLSRFDEPARAAAGRLAQNAELLAAWSLLDGPGYQSVEADETLELFRELNDASLKLLSPERVSRHESALSALQSFAAPAAGESLDGKRFGAVAAGSALLLGGLSKVSPELAEALRPALFEDLLDLRERLTAEETSSAHVDALNRLRSIAADSKDLADTEDADGRVFQISDVLGDAVHDADYVAAVARQLPKAGDESRSALLVTDDESALRAALKAAGAEAGPNVVVRTVESLGRDAIRRGANGDIESIDVAALPGAGDALAKIRIFTRTPALWWLGNIAENRREALVEFLLWVTRDAAFRLTPANLEDVLRAQKILDIQA